MNDLRQQFLDSLRESQFPRTAGKVLMAKSAAPELIAVRNSRGEVLGFGIPEKVSREEIAKMANLDSLNDIFDDFFFGSATASTFPQSFPLLSESARKEDLLKSTGETPADEFANLFPF